ncbi:Uncharacterised protein [Klebsiella pneumoniae]|nr:Uncharacterised protein [Klebsiella pneumoniae]
MPIFGIGFKVGRLDLFADKLGIFRDQITFQELQIAFCLLLWELLALDLLFQDVEQMDRVCRHFYMIEVEHAGEDLKRKTRRQTVHPFIDTGVVTIFLIRLGFGIGVFQTFAIINPHL